MFELDQYKVVFQYADGIRVTIPPVYDPLNVQIRSGVYAHILQDLGKETKDGKKDWQYLFTGLAILHPNDQPVKNDGRKKAFTRALNHSGFDRETRTRFWNAYWKARGKID